jgi:hypothetical protein
MTISDIAIIYFACGAPLGVYTFYSRANTWHQVALAILAWPIIGVRLATSMAGQGPASTHETLLTIRHELESQLMSGSLPESVFEFREVFDRYTGLAQAATESSATAVSGLLELTAHPSVALAESCMSRSQKDRLRRHLNAARSEFASFLNDASSADVERCVETLQELVEDTSLMIYRQDAVVTRPSLRETARVG